MNQPEWQKRMKKLFKKLWEEGDPARRTVYVPQTIWDCLAIEGQHALIATLHKVEKGESGYATLIEPDEGYSRDPVTNELVKRWLGTQKVLVYNINREKAELEQALTSQKEALS